MSDDFHQRVAESDALRRHDHEKKRHEAIRYEAFMQGFVAARDPRTAAATLIALVDAEKAYRDELRTLIVKISRETPYPAELDECRSARRALIAEVGTLRAQLAEQAGMTQDQLADALNISRYQYELLQAAMRSTPL